jgi:polysaccharide chain length determinant protein (PEP-CTERM system associated)
MIPGKQYSPDELVWAVWRRKGLILASFLLITTATIVVAGTLRDRYRAEALIVTTPQSVSQEFVRATITPRTQIRDRLPTISQQILSRSRLEPVIRDLNLYADLRRIAPMEGVIDRMRKDIAIKVVEGSESFRISYEAAETPLLAVQVTERLARAAVDANMRDREVLARETSTFLQSQLEDARRRLVEQEKRLETYRLRYGPELPNQLQSNMQAIQNAQLQIQSLNDSLNRDRDRRMLVARQLADLQSEQFTIEQLPAGAGASSATAPLPPDASAAVRLEAALAELRSLEGRVTPQHPDLIRAKRLVEQLEKKAQEEAEAKPNPNARAKPLTATEIAKRNRVKELQAEIESLDRQIAKKIADEVELRATLHGYRARVEAVPTRESELASLTRDYETLQSQYRTLLTKKEDSKVAEELERQQVGEQFKIVDPPRLPEKPFRPNRPLIDLAGAGSGLVLGIGLALLLELRDKSLKSGFDARLVLGIPVLGLIPMMITAADRRHAHWRRAAFSLGFVVMFAACATAIWLTFRF